MKLKNVGFLAKHFEKMLISMAGVMLLLSVYLYYISGSPHEADISSLGKLPPRQIDLEIQKKVNDLLVQINSDQMPPDLQNISPLQIADPVQKQFKLPSYPEGHLKSALAQKPFFGSDIRPPDDVKFYEPTVPAAQVVSLRAYMLTIDTASLSSAAQGPLAPAWKQTAIGQATGPVDLTPISLSISMPWGQFLAELNKLPENDDIRMIKQDWWVNKVGIADVHVQRLRNRDNGSFPKEGDADYAAHLTERLLSMPTTTFDPAKVATETDVQKSAELLRNILVEQNALLNPVFPATLGASAWTHPRLEAAAGVPVGGGAPAVGIRPAPAAAPAAGPNRFETQMQQKFEEMRELQSKLAEKGQDKALEQKVRKLEQEIEKLQEQYRGTETRPTAPSPSRAPAPADGALRPGADGQPAVEIIQLNKDEETEILVHDLLTEEGVQYQYRVRVGASNPLFQKPELPPTQSGAIGKQLLLYSGWSEWSKPVATDKLKRFFTLSTTQASNQLTVDVWKFHYGAWRNSKFRAQPGSPIGEKSRLAVTDQINEMDFYTGAHLVDMETGYLVSAPGAPGGKRATILVLYTEKGRILTRRMDEDRDAQRKWEAEHAGSATAGN